MNQPYRASAIVALFLLINSIPAFAGPPINIRTEKAGKLLLVVDDETLRTAPDAKPILYIDGPRISTEKGGKLLFFIDGDILHAYKPEGSVVGYKDGRQLKTAPGGSETLYIDGPIIRKPNKYGDPAYYIDGQVMSNQQLMAVIYTLKPELFNMPKDDGSPAPEAPAAVATPAPATPSAAPAKEFTGGTYSIASYKSSDGSKHTGKIIIKKQGDIFAMDLNFAEGAAMQGVAVLENGELHAAVGPANTMGLADYQITDGTLNGTWLNVTGGSSGLENLTGSKDIGGIYNITSAKAPFTGAAYTGTVTVDPVTGTTLDTDAPVYHLAWDLGGYKAQGVGFKAGLNLVAATSTAPDYSVIRFKIDPTTGALNGDFYTLSKATGNYTLTRDGD